MTPTLRLTRLGLAAQTVAGVETLLGIAIVLDVLTTDLVGYHSTQNVTVSRIPGTGNYSFCLVVIVIVIVIVFGFVFIFVFVFTNFPKLNSNFDLFSKF